MDLKTLTELRAPSGNEQPLRRALLEEIKGMGLEPKLDRLGNVVVVKPGTQGKDAKRVMLSAHMDEVGLIVANVTEEGFLRPLPIGGGGPSRDYQQAGALRRRCGARRDRRHGHPSANRRGPQARAGLR